MSLDKPYNDVPGTTIFDADMSRQGYHLNQFCMSLMKAENRARFKANERAYLDEWPMSEEQKQAVLARDLNRCIALGGNIYFLAKIGATDGKSFQQMAGSMTGMSEEEYRDMMVSGRPLGRRQPLHRGEEVMARITASVYTSHVPADRRGDRPRQDRRALLAAGLQGLRILQAVAEGAEAGRDLSGLQRSRHRLQPRHHPDLRDRHGGRIRAGRRRLGPASGAEGDRPSETRRRTSRSR